MRREGGYGGYEADYYSNGRHYIDEPSKTYYVQAMAYGMVSHGSDFAKAGTIDEPVLASVTPHLVLL